MARWGQTTHSHGHGDLLMLFQQPNRIIVSIFVNNCRTLIDISVYEKISHSRFCMEILIAIDMDDAACQDV